IAVSNGETVLDLVAAYDGCTAGHKGTLVDLGDAGGMYRFGRLHKGDIEAVEHEGATWARVHSKALQMEVVVPEIEGDASTTSVTARVRGGAAKSASVFVNGKTIGTWSLAKGESKVVTAHAPVAAITPGANEVLVRLNAPAHTAPTETL